MRSDLTHREYGKYKGLSLFIRAYDEQNNPIIYLQDYSTGFHICGYKVFTSRIKDSTIVESGIRIFSDTCHLTISSIDSDLVKEFTGMRIRRLMVDNADNVFISLRSLDGFDMIKLVNYNDSMNKYKIWTQLGRNWYLRPS
jgi:hypothetical protein